MPFLNSLVLSVVRVEMGDKTVVKKFVLSLVAWMPISDLKVGDRLHDLFLFCNISVMRLC